MALGCDRARKQVNPRTIHIQGKKHANVRKVSLRYSQGSLETPGFHRWRYMVSSSLQVPKTKTPSSFLVREKSDRKEDAVYQGQNRRF